MYSSSSSSPGALTIKRGESFPVVVDNGQVLVLSRPTFGANPITDVSFRSNSSRFFVGIRMVRYAIPVTPLGCSTCSVGTWRPLHRQYTRDLKGRSLQAVLRTLHSLGVISPQKKGKDPCFAAPSALDVGSGPVINHWRSFPAVVSLPPGTSARYFTPLPSPRARELIISEIVEDVPRNA